MDLISSVRYDGLYRKIYREKGIEAMLEMVYYDSIDSLSEEEMQELRKAIEDYAMGSYKIQVYSINQPITILGHTFSGLNDIIRHIELSSSNRRFSKGLWCTVPLQFRETGGYADIHIGELYEKYPCFDAEDYANENRYYQNFIFRKQPVTQGDLEALYDLPQSTNFCKVTEQIPEDILPILYYKGEGSTMLLATKDDE